MKRLSAILNKFIILREVDCKLYCDVSIDLLAKIAFPKSSSLGRVFEKLRFHDLNFDFPSQRLNKGIQNNI